MSTTSDHRGSANADPPMPTASRALDAASWTMRLHDLRLATGGT